MSKLAWRSQYFPSCPCTEYGDEGSERHLSSSFSKKERFFWQYNVQAKGPKGQRLVLTPSELDPHRLEEIVDPVFNPAVALHGIRHRSALIQKAEKRARLLFLFHILSWILILILEQWEGSSRGWQRSDTQSKEALQHWQGVGTSKCCHQWHDSSVRASIHSASTDPKREE